MVVVMDSARAAELPTVSAVIPAYNAAATIERARYLIDHPHLWPEMGRAGRAFVEENFNMRKLNERLVRIYEDVIAGRPVAAAADPPESPRAPHPQRVDT